MRWVMLSLWKEFKMWITPSLSQCRCRLGGALSVFPLWKPFSLPSLANQSPSLCPWTHLFRGLVKPSRNGAPAIANHIPYVYKRHCFEGCFVSLFTLLHTYGWNGFHSLFVCCYCCVALNQHLFPVLITWGLQCMVTAAISQPVILD